MKSNRTAASKAVISLAVLLFIVLDAAAQSGMVDAMNYRGLLTHADGRLLEDGAYEVRFSLHDEAAGGNELFAQVVRTHVRAGVYEVFLSGDAGESLRDALGGGERYLEAEVLSGAGISLPQRLRPRQRLASAAYALLAYETERVLTTEDPLPPSSILLWDQATGCDGDPGACPCGFDVAPEFDGRTVRGALAGELPGIDLGVPGGNGPDGDALTESELPAHDHLLETEGGHRHEIASYNGTVARLSGSGVRAGPENIFNPPEGGLDLTGVSTSSAGNHLHVIDAAGGDGPHYHPLRSVLFCRKVAP